MNNNTKLSALVLSKDGKNLVQCICAECNQTIVVDLNTFTTTHKCTA